jgi:anti-anti-sigma factor
MNSQTPVVITPIEGGFHVALSGPIHTNTALIEGELNQVIARNPKKIELDLAGCDHIASVGLGMLVNFQNRIKGQGGAVRIVKMLPRMQEILRAAYLHRFFDIAPDAVIDADVK